MHTCSAFCRIYFSFSPLPRSSPTSSSQILNLVSDGLPDQPLVCKPACLSTKLKLCLPRIHPALTEPFHACFLWLSSESFHSP